MQKQTPKTKPRHVPTPRPTRIPVPRSKLRSTPTPTVAARSTPTPKTTPKPKEKSFDDHFRECIKNKQIPKDAPEYLKKALERAKEQYDVGIKHVKSALENFAEKYVIKEDQELCSMSFFRKKRLK